MHTILNKNIDSISLFKTVLCSHTIVKMSTTILDMSLLDPDRVVLYERWIPCNESEESSYESESDPDAGPDADPPTDSDIHPAQMLRLERIAGMLSLADPTRYHMYKGFNKFTTETFELPAAVEGWLPYTNVTDHDIESEDEDADNSFTDDQIAKALKDKIDHFRKKIVPRICDLNRKPFVPSNQKISELYPTYQMYKTQDNGGVGFIVFVKDLDVRIYGRPQNQLIDKEDEVPADETPDEFSYERNMTELIKHYEAIEIFIGKSTLNMMTEFSGGHGPEWDGNSILLKIGQTDNTHTYASIGTCIYEFTTTEPITEYVSSVGNNCVPYPYAVSANYVYSMESMLRSKLSDHPNRLERGYVDYADDVTYEDMHSTLVAGRNTDSFDYAFPSQQQTPVIKFTRPVAVQMMHNTCNI